MISAEGSQYQIEIHSNPSDKNILNQPQLVHWSQLQCYFTADVFINIFNQFYFFNFSFSHFSFSHFYVLLIIYFYIALIQFQSFQSQFNLIQFKATFQIFSFFSFIKCLYLISASITKKFSTKFQFQVTVTTLFSWSALQFQSHFQVAS